MQQAHRVSPIVRMSLRLVFMLLAGCAAINFGVIAVGQTAPPPTNPFLSYEDIFPGQPVDTVKARGFGCSQIANYYVFEERCALDVNSGVFSRIETVISGSTVSQITLTLRSNAFEAGDLALFFDKTKFGVYPKNVFFFWKQLFVNVSTSPTENAAFLRPVWSVTLTNKY